MYFKYTILLIIALFTILIQTKVYYNYVLNKYFRNGDDIVYDYLIKLINCVSKKNYFMNYGLWDIENNTLIKANKNLCSFIFEKARFNSVDKFYILDVGCGYGKQDFLLHNIISCSSKIIAVDLSKTQIDFANKYRKKKRISKKQLKFIETDAHFLIDKFGCQPKFNRIMSIESAFHYKNRNKFFNNVNNLLTDDGLFVISDIVLKEDYEPTFVNKLFLNIASDFLCIPEQNLIHFNEWKKQLENNNFKINEIYNITDKTFLPYYTFFFENYIKNQNLPNFLSSILIYIFNNTQTFTYAVAVCSKL